jgi:hypothetical protein
MGAVPRLKDIVGLPNFHSDKDVLPLQAADLNAGWAHERAIARHDNLPDDGQPPPCGDKGDSVLCINQYWTAEEMRRFAELPEKGLASDRGI